MIGAWPLPERAAGRLAAAAERLAAAAGPPELAERATRHLRDQLDILVASA